VTITLTGTRPASVFVSKTSDKYEKGIIVEGAGALDLHGAQFAPTWTRLAAPVERGDRWIFLQDLVNWEIGNTILVATTAIKDSRDYSESEEASIMHIFALPNGMTAVHINAPLAFDHYAGREYQAEVGLLSRRVIVQGAVADSLPTDAYPILCPTAQVSQKAVGYFSALPCGNTSLTGFGGHIMISGSGGAAGRISGTLLLRMGQTNFLGRYPFHLHLVNASGESSFITDSAIWRSYYRCVSLHGALNARVSRNVAHDVA
jgi:hypothetical protein